MKFKISDFLHKQSYASILFLSPAVIGIFVFIIIPTIASFGLSFTQWDLLNEIKFVGLANYKEIFTDKVFIKILINTLVYSLSVTVLGVIIPLILACLLNSKIYFKDFYKTAYFIPFITPMIVSAIVWEWIFDPNIGCLNAFLNLHINWLYDPNFAMPALIIVSVWKLIGYNMIIFLAGFSGINTELIEASKIDGANQIQTFLKIIVPLLSPTVFFVIIITALGSFQVFDLIYLMTQGGPLDSTNIIVYAIYKNAFEYFRIGKASALAYVLFIIIFILTAFQWHFRKKMVYLEKD